MKIEMRNAIVAALDAGQMPRGVAKALGVGIAEVEAARDAVNAERLEQARTAMDGGASAGEVAEATGLPRDALITLGVQRPDAEAPAETPPAVEVKDRVLLREGITGYPPTSGGGAYVVSAVDEGGRFCVDGLSRWLEPEQIDRVVGQ
jgi:hypothetical protein